MNKSGVSCEKDKREKKDSDERTQINRTKDNKGNKDLDADFADAQYFISA
jgi:hypothetical protein